MTFRHQYKLICAEKAGKPGRANARRGMVFLPGCLFNAGDLTLIGQLSEANTADTVVSQICVRTAANFAAVVAAAGKLSFLLLL